jgi:ribosomal protein S12 methylthiotransferase
LSENTVEAEYLLGVLKSKSFEIINDIEKADIAAAHTCSFIKIAKEESEKTIRGVLLIKKKTGLRVYVSGCLPQLLQDKMISLFPEIDENIKILSDKSLKLDGFYKAEIKGVRGYNIKAAMENINELGQ